MVFCRLFWRAQTVEESELPSSRGTETGWVPWKRNRDLAETPMRMILPIFEGAVFRSPLKKKPKGTMNFGEGGLCALILKITIPFQESIGPKPPWALSHVSETAIGLQDVSNGNPTPNPRKANPLACWQKVSVDAGTWSIFFTPRPCQT